MSPSSRLYLFTGENAYLLRQERQKWVREFVTRHDEDNLTKIDAGDVSFRELLDEVSTAPFLAAKRLVLVRGVPSMSKEDVQTLAAAIHEDCIVAFFEPKLDKRLGGAKALLATATVKECGPVSGAPLRRWLQAVAQELQTSIDDQAIDALIATVGEDQDALYQELQKIALYASGRAVMRKDIETLSVAFGEQEVWALTNLIAARKRDEALRMARRMLERGEDAYSLWSILLWMLRNIVSVTLAVQEGVKNPAQIASGYGVPFPSAKSLLPFCQRIDGSALWRTVDWAADADVQLKTGGYRSTQEAPEEIEALMDQLIMKTASLG